MGRIIVKTWQVYVTSIFIFITWWIYYEKQGGLVDISPTTTAAIVITAGAILQTVLTIHGNYKRSKEKESTKDRDELESIKRTAVDDKLKALVRGQKEQQESNKAILALLEENKIEDVEHKTDYNSFKETTQGRLKKIEDKVFK